MTSAGALPACLLVTETHDSQATLPPGAGPLPARGHSHRARGRFRPHSRSLLQ